MMKRSRTLVLLPLCLASLWAAAQQGGDLQAQILFAFYAEDSNQLASLVQRLGTEEQANGADNALRYHLAHAQYRSGLLAVQKHARTAGAAFEACVDELQVLLDQDADSVEALVLQSACLSDLARLKKIEAVLLRSRAEYRIKRAARLAPRNPRVEMLGAAEALARAKPGSEEGARAFGELQRAAQSFEQTSATGIDEPGWGHAETYLELGRQLELRGDFLGARNWIEKSLIIAPDFKAAQRQLAALQRR